MAHPTLKWDKASMRLRIGYTDMGEEAWLALRPSLSAGLNASKDGHFELRGLFYKSKNSTQAIPEGTIDTERLVPELIESDDWRGSAVKLWTEYMVQEQEKDHRLHDQINTGTRALGSNTSRIHSDYEIIDADAISSQEAPPKYTPRHDKHFGIATSRETRAASDLEPGQTTLRPWINQTTLMSTKRKSKRGAPLSIDIHPHKKQKTLNSWITHP